MKTYVIIVSERFPNYHRRAGELTNFPSLITREKKLHTIRGNYKLWAQRFEQIEKGAAFLSVRVWTGKPYKSKQQELARFHKKQEIGIQKADFSYDYSSNVLIDGKEFSALRQLAKNDGLRLSDFEDWFKNHNLSEPMAIIHFTNLRY